MPIEDEVKEESVEEVSPAAEPENDSTETVVDNAESTSVEGTNTNGSGDVKEITPKREFSDLEKAEYSFHKQFSKQKKKYEAELARRDESFKQLQDRLDRLENPEKYREKNRNDFSTDDDYINHLVEQRLTKMLEEREKQAAEKAKVEQEQSEKERVENERINNNIRACFGTDEKINEYRTKVSEAFEQGLEQLIDNTPELSNYIQRSVNGPKILYKLATDANSVKAIFEGAIDNYDIAFRVRELEKSILAEETKPAAEVAAQTNRESIGTPGKASGKNSAFSVFDDPVALRKFMNS